MPVHVKHFDRDKALEIIVYISSNLTAPSPHSVSKILYLSDKLHLQKYGRLICGDSYIAMEYGPVPSAIYDMIKVVTQNRSIDVDWDVLIKEALRLNFGRTLVPLRAANLNLISQSEISALDETLTIYGGKTFGELTDITHDAAWQATSENQSIEIGAIVSTLPNADEVNGYLIAQ